MAGLTLLQARANVRRLLDDDGSNNRYSDTAIDESLKVALSTCLSDYATSGGDAFDTEISITTVAGVGTLTGPLVLVRTVQVAVGQSFYTLEAQLRSDRRLADLSARDLRVLVVKDYQLSSTTSHPLVGESATAANTWFAFDQWVCANGALICGITDNDKRPGLEALEARMRGSVLNKENTPQSRPMPDSRQGQSWWSRLGFVYTAGAASPTISLVQRDAWL